MFDTIFAVASGAPPAAIAVLRISGPQVAAVPGAFGCSLPAPRRASLRRLCDASGAELDRAIMVWFPGPATATGEDLLELHLHGGRAVLSAVERYLESLTGLRRAEPGEFTRRAFANGRIDLAEAEGLADLLAAETELQRQQAMATVGGALSAQVEGWREQVLIASASVEAVLDFADEDDVGGLPPSFGAALAALAHELGTALDAPRLERLRDGIKVVIAGPPNSGKSSLFNKLVQEEAAITAPIAGTTRDVLTRAVAIEGIPLVFIDTAGLRDDTPDPVETIGIERARGEMDKADLVLWLGPEGEGRGPLLWEIESFVDCRAGTKTNPRHSVSSTSGAGLNNLRQDLVEWARNTLPRPGAAALNQRQYDLVTKARTALVESVGISDPLLIAEGLRQARVAFDRLLGRSATEDMLDTLFERFCIGK